MERKLASVQVVKRVAKILNADNLEVVTILGWKVVAKKGEFKVGDKCVYFEIDSLLPANDTRYEFLRKTCYRNNKFLGEGFKISTIKLRGQISQGLIMPISEFPELDTDIAIGTDVTDVLNVKKWELQDSGLGQLLRTRPAFVNKTDETRIQSEPSLLDVIKGKPYYITQKMDGSSCSIYKRTNEDNIQIGVTTRNQELVKDINSRFWRFFLERDFEEKLKNLPYENIVLQGEMCGIGIQGNKIGLKEDEWYVFNIFVENEEKTKMLNYDEMKEIANILDIKLVPLIEDGESFNYSLEELLEKADGKYPNGKTQEGIVIRTKERFYNETLDKEFSFKVINNKYLLKHNE